MWTGPDIYIYVYTFMYIGAGHHESRGPMPLHHPSGPGLPH